MYAIPTFGLGIVASPTELFDSSLTFPTIQVFDTEAEFIDSTAASNYTIVHAKDTDRLYVWDGNIWFGYDNDSTV